MIFGLCQETSYTAITLNPVSSFTRRERNHSLFHWGALTDPELLVQIWMSSKKTYRWLLEYRWCSRLVRSLDRFHTIYSIGRQSSRRICVNPVRDWRESSLHPCQIIYGQSYGSQWERTPSWSRSKSGLKRSSILRTHEYCEESIYQPGG